MTVEAIRALNDKIEELEKENTILKEKAIEKEKMNQATLESLFKRVEKLESTTVTTEINLSKK